MAHRTTTPTPAHASAPALSLRAAVFPITVLRARKPLRYPGYPADLERPLDRIVPALIVLTCAAYWFVTSPSIATLAAG